MIPNLDEVIENLYAEIYLDIKNIDEIIAKISTSINSKQGETAVDTILVHNESINNFIKNKISAREQLFKLISLIKEREKALLSNAENSDEIVNMNEILQRSKTKASSSLTFYEDDEDDDED